LGCAKDVSYRNITVNNVQQPILVDQFYNQKGSSGGVSGSDLKLSRLLIFLELTNQYCEIKFAIINIYLVKARGHYGYPFVQTSRVAPSSVKLPSIGGVVAKEPTPGLKSCRDRGYMY
jgi:hypothetical protein